MLELFLMFNRGFTKPRFVLVSLACRVPPDVVHEPVEDLHVAVNRDVHLLPSLRIHGQVLGKVTHLFHQEVSGTREVLLQVLSLIAHVDDHVGTVGGQGRGPFVRSQHKSLTHDASVCFS